MTLPLRVFARFETEKDARAFCFLRDSEKRILFCMTTLLDRAIEAARSASRAAAARGEFATDSEVRAAWAN